MRLPGAGQGHVLAGLVPAPSAAEAVAGAGEPLLGAWSATRWEYTRVAEPRRTLDVVCDLGGSVTLSLSAGTYVLTWAAAGRGSRSSGGSFAVRVDQLELRPLGAAGVETVRYRLGPGVLALSSTESAAEFDGQEEAAEFVAVFVRL